MFSEMAKYTKKEHTPVIWNCLVTAIDNLLRKTNFNNVESEKLNYLAQLTEIWIEWKQGALIVDTAQLQKVMMRYLFIAYSIHFISFDCNKPFNLFCFVTRLHFSV